MRLPSLLLPATLGLFILCAGCDEDYDEKAPPVSEGQPPAAQPADGRGFESPEKGSGATWPSRIPKKKAPKRGMDSLPKPPADQTPEPPEPTRMPGESEKK